MAMLSPKHRHLLEVESGISPQVIADRGYYTEPNPAGLAALGFDDYQRRPSLVIPQWTTAGVQIGHVIRPDNPRRDVKGKLVKYESLAGRRLQVDVPPGVARPLRDTSVPLWITEGSRKADAAWSLGLACISLSGVWGFMSGKVILPDLDDIDFNGRLVRIAFDSDVMRKASVREALDRLAAALDRRGATVEAVYLPEVVV